MHDTASAFTGLDYSPQLTNRTWDDAVTPAANRQQPDNIFNPSLSAAVSLGVGGSLVLRIEPFDLRTITRIEITETNLRPNGSQLRAGASREQAELSVSTDGTNWVQVATLRTRNLSSGGADVIGTGDLFHGGTVDSLLARDVFTIDLVDTGTAYSWLRILDTSPPRDGFITIFNATGFDIAFLSLTSAPLELAVAVPVPAPAALPVFGLALLGLGLACRRQRAA